jgi:hypothetical protein
VPCRSGPALLLLLLLPPPLLLLLPSPLLLLLPSPLLLLLPSPLLLLLPPPLLLLLLPPLLLLLLLPPLLLPPLLLPSVYRAALLGHCMKQGVLKASSCSRGGGVLPKLNLHMSPRAQSSTACAENNCSRVGAQPLAGHCWRPAAAFAQHSKQARRGSR